MDIKNIVNEQKNITRDEKSKLEDVKNILNYRACKTVPAKNKPRSQINKRFHPKNKPAQ